MTIKLKNNVVGYLATAISASDTGVVLQTGNGANFPSLGAGEYFYATLVSSGGTLEVVQVTARSGDSMTVVRAQDGSSAAGFAVGSRVEMRVNAQAVLDVVDQVTASQVGFTPTGGIAATDVQAAISEVVSDLAASSGSSLVGFLQAGTGASSRTVQSKLRDVVSVKDFGAVCDGSTDDSSAVQLAINYCSTFSRWPALVIPGRCRIGSSVNIDRLVDSTFSEFRIIGQGEGAGFYTTSGVTIFDSTLATTTAPQSEFVTFENIQFETSSIFNASYVLSKKFLRVKFLNCNFRLIRCINSTIYVQTLYFSNCNIRNTPASFVECVGLYDVSFNHCVIENGNTVVKNLDTVRGTAGLRFIDCVIEGIQSSITNCAAASGFDLIGCHLEANFSPEFNFFAGGTNGSITVVGNYIYNPAGATFYYGPTTKVFSAGNFASPSALHSNAVQITDLISCADNCSGGISDATVNSTVNGVYRAGTSAIAWTDTSGHLRKSAGGMFGFGNSELATSRATFWGADQTSSNYAGQFLDSAGNAIAAFRNDRFVLVPALQNYTNDANAAIGGVPIGGLYRNGSVVQVRVT